MIGKTHAGLGAAAGLALSDKIPGGFKIVGMLVVIIASLLPDIDHPKSIVNKYILPFKSKLVKLIIYVFLGLGVLVFNYYHGNIPAFIALGTTLIMIGFSSHRKGLTHSLLGLVIFSFIISYISNRYNMSFAVYYFIIGYGLHILCDMTTSRGVPLLYPLSKKNFKFPIIYRVGSKKGSLFEKILLIACVLYFVYRIPFVLQ
ncbi:MAG: metal-dependent hydrolase [Bacillota bacterium]|nr:metal-dependent hydrolase [Bacillota bacterium]